MVTPSDPQAAALLTHVITQMQDNVTFLVNQKYISAVDGSAIMAKLPTNPTIAPFHTATVAPPPRRVTVQPTPQIVHARALWSYNTNGEEPNDLSFSVGDIIEIVAETNEDWWMGRINGRQALFPANYVEKIEHTSSDALRNVPSQPQNTDIEKPVYKPFMAAHHGADAPPPPGGSDVNSIGLQEAPGQEAKKSKFGKYGNTMAHSAAGGVGFGAGAAIGGGLVRAIF